MTAYTTSLRLTLPVQGTEDGIWGDLVNTGITTLTDAAIAGTSTVAQGNVANYTLTNNSGSTDQARNMFLNITGALTANRNVVCPAVSKLYFIKNSTTGGFAITLKTSAGTGVSIPNGEIMALYCNGTNVINAITRIDALTATNLHASGSGGFDTNEAIGIGALTSNVSGENNVAVGNSALNVNTTGNDNTAIGAMALSLNVDGTANTAVGQGALEAVVSGTYNTALGAYALNLATGAYNTAVGAAALLNATACTGNVACGTQALQLTTTGSYNVAVGYLAMQDNLTGGYNVAVGDHALFANTSGEFNSALGYYALSANTIGTNNIAVGYLVMGNSIGGVFNTAIGDSAMLQNTYGNYNVAVGNAALSGVTTGSGNMGLGGTNAVGTFNPVFNPTVENNRICMGSSSATNAYIQVAWTVVSDARDKTDFAPVPHGLDFVAKLKPTAYRYKETRDATAGHGPIRYGFKAQDVLTLEGDTPVIVDAEDSEKLRFNDQALVAVLVNAIQELNAKFDAYVASHP